MNFSRNGFYKGDHMKYYDFNKDGEELDLNSFFKSPDTQISDMLSSAGRALEYGATPRELGEALKSFLDKYMEEKGVDEDGIIF